MKRILVPVLAVFLALASRAVAGTLYGGGVTVERASSISDILAEPGSYVGKTVKVTGKVVDVCAHRGCWMDLAGEASGQAIRVKVEDGVIVFPASARGRQATVQGAVEMMTPCPEEAAAAGGKAVLAIRATGAVIE
ncbi:MAG: DUF4920 domain-containing protein [Deltaproteobacteria bacterium]